MAIARRARTYSNKPSVASRVSTAHPVGHDAVIVWATNEGGGGTIQDATHQQPTCVVSLNAPAWNNLGLNSDGTKANVVGGTASPMLEMPYGASAAWAIEVYLALTATSSLAAVFGFGASQAYCSNHNGYGRYFLTYGGTSPYNIYFWSGTRDWSPTVQWIVDGLPHHYVFTTPGGSTTPTISLYVDGIFRASGTPSGALVDAIDPLSGNATFVTGFSGHTSRTSSITGSLIKAAIYNRNLTAGEVNGLAVNPWSIFETYPSRQYWMSPPSTGGSYSFPAPGLSVTGSIGTDATTIVAANDGITITGTAGSVVNSVIVSIISTQISLSTGAISVVAGGIITVSVSGLLASISPGGTIEALSYNSASQVVSGLAGAVNESIVTSVTGVVIVVSSGTVQIVSGGGSFTFSTDALLISASCGSILTSGSSIQIYPDPFGSSTQVKTHNPFGATARLRGTRP